MLSDLSFDPFVIALWDSYSCYYSNYVGEAIEAQPVYIAWSHIAGASIWIFVPPSQIRMLNP